MVPIEKAKELVRKVIESQKLSRHETIAIGISFRIERLRRCVPGGMYNRTGSEVEASHIARLEKNLERSRVKEQRLWAQIIASDVTILSELSDEVVHRPIQ